MLGIVIPLYKNEDQVAKCKAALAKQTFKDFKIIEVDNNEVNIGFTRAVNKGIKENLDCDLFVVLNQDCYLKEDALDKMVSFMKKYPNCGIGGIKQLQADNDDLIVHGGCTQAFPHGRHIGGRVSKGECDKNAKMPWVNGACMIVRKSTIIDIGLMDKNFIMIGSDSDWCYTARLRGWDVWYIADASCLHEGGVSSGTEDESLNTQMKIDTLYFREKWISAGNFKELSKEIF